MTTAASIATPVPSGPAGRPHPWLQRYAALVTAATFVLIAIGSTVTTTDSGLAVPDWPTTFHQNMWTFPLDRWVGGIFFEHGHRMVASAVGLLTVGLCVWLWRSTHPRWLKRLGLVALFAVCLQGMLGGLTVRWQLPPAVSVAHAGLAQLFFALMVVITVTAGGSAPWRVPVRPDGGRLWRATWILAVCLYAQIIAGAVMRHTHATLAIPDFPMSYGSIMPPTTTAALQAVNQERVWGEPPLEPVTLAQIWIHFAHRAGILVVAGAALWLARLAADCSGRLPWLALGLVLMILIQGVLGALAIWTARSLAMSTLHVAGGTLMFGVAVWAMLEALRPAVVITDPER